MNLQHIHAGSWGAWRVPWPWSKSPRRLLGRRRGEAHGGREGFSLIEVVLAMGVVSFAFMPVLGLLPMGASNFRNSIDCTVGAQISQQLVNQAQETDFSALPSISGTTYFDVDGKQMPNATGAIYSARTSVTLQPELPGASSANEDMATVTVQIANNPGHQTLATDPQTNLWKASSGVSMKTYSTVVSGCQSPTVSGT